MLVSCSWCHELNFVEISTCWNCGHDADRPRTDCGCLKCWQPLSVYGRSEHFEVGTFAEPWDDPLPPGSLEGS